MRAVFRGMPQRLVTALMGSTILALAGAGGASAATYTVNTTTDGTTCSSSSCSLRGAVIAADKAGGSSTIDVPAGLYKLAIASTGPNDPATGDLDINNNANVTIDGAGSDATILNANKIDRLFAVQQGASLTLSGMTLREGDPSPKSSPAAAPGPEGGAVYTDGGLTVTGDVVFQDNQANYQYSGQGGAIFADTASTLALTGATFENNDAYLGSAVDDESAQPLNVKKSAFVSNGSSFFGAGAAIFNGGASSGALNVDSSTFNGNTAFEAGAILWAANSAVNVTHSTFSGNSAEAAAGAIGDMDSSAMTLAYDAFTNNTSSSGFCIGLANPAAQTRQLKARLAVQPQINGCGGGGGAVALASGATGASYTLAHDMFKGNSASFAGDGGAVAWIYGTLSSTDSSYIDNIAGDAGGAIYAYAETPQSLTLINDTMSHNGGNAVYGGALYVNNTTPASLINDTVTDNQAYYDSTTGTGYGGGINGGSHLTATGYTGPGTAGIQNTVIAGNNGGDCATADGTFTKPFDLGHNMDSDGSCFSTSVQSTDMPSTEPNLGNPANNGGPLVGNQSDGSATTILTDAESAASTTVNKGTNTNCPSTDERGVARPQGGLCDIGAFELAAAGLHVKKSAARSVKVHSLFTYTIKVSNSGPGYSTGTTLIDKLPGSETLKDLIPSRGVTCSHAGRSVTCKIGILRMGGSATVKVIVQANRTGRIKNTAEATNAQGSKAFGHASTKVTAIKAARKRRAPTFTG